MCTQLDTSATPWREQSEVYRGYTHEDIQRPADPLEKLKARQKATEKFFKECLPHLFEQLRAHQVAVEIELLEGEPS